MKHPTLGSYLGDAGGMALYVLRTDTKATGEALPVSTCTAACLDTWPLFSETELVLGAELSATDFGLFTRPDGYSQATFKGWPLHSYSGDTKAGDANGQGKGDKWYAAGTPIPAAPTVAVTKDAALGEYLVDGQGLTLYVKTADSQGAGDAAPVSTCAEGCLASWPVFSPEALVAGSGLAAGDLGSFTRPDGATQATYKGWPLYLNAQDTVAGERHGEGQSNWGLIGPQGRL